jgi:hypothetical protein
MWDIENLDWKIWPHDKAWRYADVADFVRISATGSDFSTRTFQPGDESDRPTGARFIGVSRDQLNGVLDLLALDKGLDPTQLRKSVSMKNFSAEDLPQVAQAGLALMDSVSRGHPHYRPWLAAAFWGVV